MRRTYTCFFATLCAVIAAANAYGFTTEVATTGTNSSDNYANGTIQDAFGGVMGTWGLTTTVSNTDFFNDGLQGGEDGLQYVMLNNVGASSDTNTIRFDVTPSDPSHHTNITISQSPYHNLETWNGGDNDISQFLLTWNDTAGAITISDPLNQLAAFQDGQSISQSPVLVQFANNRVFNSNDEWSIDLPPTAQSAELDWSSSNPSAGSTLTREWVTFDSNVAAAAVPEPAAGVMLMLAGFMVIGVTRRRR